jgi:hypothetical protein
MSSFDFETPDTYDSDSPFLSEPGTYHMQVLDLQEGVNAKGTVIDGFSVDLAVVEGPQKGKKINVSILKPKPDASDNGKRIATQRISNFAIAANLLDPNQAGAGKRVSVDLLAAVQQQIVARFSIDYRNEKKYLQLDYASIWHVDDPEVAKVPKSAEFLALLPPQCRRKADWFSFKKKKESKPATAMAGSGQTKPTEAWNDL